MLTIHSFNLLVYCSFFFVTVDFGTTELTQCKAPECNGDKSHASEYMHWFLFGDYCYSIRSAADRSWYTGNHVCIDNGGTLASIHSPEENDFILGIIRGKSETNLWIGLSSRGLHSSFTWNDGTPLGFVNWDENPQHDSWNLEKCVTFDKFSGDWIIQHCNTFMSVICKKSKMGNIITPIPSIEPILPGYCSDGWYTLGNNCYKAFGLKATEKASWNQAKGKCVAIRSQLVSIHSEAEQDLLTDLVTDVGHAAWIGLFSAKRTSLYHWSDNSPLDYTSWNENEPFSNGMPEDCVELVYDEENMGKWNDVICTKPKAFICKKPKDPSLNGPKPDPSLCSYPKDWHRLGNSCFSRVLQQNSTWLKAQTMCRELESNLPIIRDYGATVFLKRYLPQTKHHLFWTGAREAVTERDAYSWITQYPMKYTNWLPGQPQRVSYENCVAISNEGKWTIRDCEENLPFFCEYDTEIYSWESYQTPLSCPNSSTSWIDLHATSNCYHVVDELATYFDAMKFCFLKGGFLASFHSPRDLDLLAPYLKSINMPAHIGLVKKYDGSFGWLDGSAFDFVHWEDGEPNSADEPCVEMDTKVMTWNDIKCNEDRPYICSVPKVFAYDAIAGVDNPTESKQSGGILGIGGIIGIAIVVIISMMLISAASYYRCQSPTTHRSRRFSSDEEDFL